MLDTEKLIKNSIKTAKYSQEEIMMILNHKTSFNYIWQNKYNYKNITQTAIKEIHQLLTQDLDITKGLRQSPVGITGTVYIPSEPVRNKFTLRTNNK